MENITSTNNKLHNAVAVSLLVGLLFLRLPFLTGIALFIMPDWLWPVFDIGTYFLTAILIWWERDQLADFHIDTLAIAMIIFFKPIQTIYLAAWKMNDDPLAFPHYPALILWSIAIGLFLTLWLGHTRLPKFSKASFGWFGIGILVGLGGVLLLGYPMSFQVDGSLLATKPDLTLLSQASTGFFYQLGFAAVTEEPLFRGFLWGYLQKARWKNVWIWLFQAGLFTLGHIYYFNKYPISLWLIVPVVSLILGAIVWRSKTISSSMATHATVNTFGYTIGYIIATIRL